MEGVTVVVPWRGGCPHREAAWEWVRARYDGWRVVEARGSEPWVKANAVMPAICAATTPIVVVADADVFCEGLADAVDRVRDGAPWAVPHKRVKRLNQKSTVRVLQGELPDRLSLEEPSYFGAPGGGLVVLPRTTALDIPLDPRFEGWGGEDRAWGWALRVLAGEPWRGDVNLFHLWHPPQPRPDRNHGTEATEELRRRYARAEQDADAMRSILEEF